MEIMEIISEALHYPLDHVKELAIYIVIMFVMALILLFTGAAATLSASGQSVAAVGAIGIIGLILVCIIGCLVGGFGLDIVKLGIERSSDAPAIEFGRQIINGIKYLILAFVYFVIPLIVMVLLSAINDTLGLFVGVILLIVFGLLLYMGICRLAKTESLGYGLNIPEAFNDLKAIGIVKVLAVLILVGIICMILNFIASIFGNFGTAGSIISAILSAIVGAYLFFFTNRAAGLLYSDLE